MQPLSGIRVIDLSQWRTGAQASQLLADFGAEVIWVEPPGGSRLRTERAFPFYCRGKRSVVIDLNGPGRAEVLDLAAGADVLIECFRPGVADRYGLGFDVLRMQNPALVYASITGFGRNSPYSAIPAYEAVVQAKLGVFKAFERMAHTDHPPYVSVPWCSFAATQLAVHGILTALIERERSGLGQWVETTMAQGFAALDTWEWMLDLVIQRFPDAYQATPAWIGDTPVSPIVFMLLVGLTKDGHWLQFSQVAPRLFAALMKALGLEWMFSDPEWKGIPAFDDAAKGKELIDRMQQAVAEKTLAEWQAIFDADPNVFAEVYRDGPAVLDHPQLASAGHVVVLTDDDHGPVRQPDRMSAFLREDQPPLATPPRLGEHGFEPDAAPDAAPFVAAGVDPSAGAPTSPPLEGVTVLELAVQFAAPYGATLLTDLGARVIKVEPLNGDIIRAMAAFPEAGGAKAMQGKESICVDISTPEGAEIVRRLAGIADVVLDGFRPGATDRAGLGAADMKKVNPDLVHVRASGYGPGGPYSSKPAFAPSIGAASGIARANLGDTVREEPGQSLADVRDGSIRLFAASAILQAQADGFAALGVTTSLLLGLLRRRRTGESAEISSSMLVTAAHAMIEEVVDYPASPPRIPVTAAMRGPNALYRIYDAAQGWVFLAAPQPSDWTRLVHALESIVELDREIFATPELRAGHDAELTEVLSDTFRTRAATDWEKLLVAAGVAGVEVTTARVERMLQSSDLSGPDSYVTEVRHPTFDVHLRLAPLVRFSRSATQAKPGVLAGSSTDSILAQLGYAPDDIEELRRRSVIA
jgi:crotonobetainyl-CoA:carnitine CoA-transferase CaiB-like acyl-CoA transferase